MTDADDLGQALGRLYFGSDRDREIGGAWFERHPHTIVPVANYLQQLTTAAWGQMPRVGSDSYYEPEIKMRRRLHTCACAEGLCVECAEPYILVYLLPGGHLDYEVLAGDEETEPPVEYEIEWLA